jgi:hypothetical protein
MIRAFCCLFASLACAALAGSGTAYAGSDKPVDGEVFRVVIDGEPETTVPPDQAIKAALDACENVPETAQDVTPRKACACGRSSPCAPA